MTDILHGPNDHTRYLEKGEGPRSELGSLRKRFPLGFVAALAGLEKINAVALPLPGKSENVTGDPCVAPGSGEV